MELSGRGKEFILIVEDEGDAARLLADHLQRRGYDTVIAADGRAALNAAFEHRPDLVILDLMLPELHGFEVCRLLKSSPRACADHHVDGAGDDGKQAQG